MNIYIIKLYLGLEIRQLQTGCSWQILLPRYQSKSYYLYQLLPSIFIKKQLLVMIMFSKLLKEKILWQLKKNIALRNIFHMILAWIFICSSYFQLNYIIIPLPTSSYVKSKLPLLLGLRNWLHVPLPYSPQIV